VCGCLRALCLCVRACQGFLSLSVAWLVDTGSFFLSPVRDAGTDKMGEGAEVVKGSCVLISCDMQVRSWAEMGGGTGRGGVGTRWRDLCPCVE
jgi:hypothetical protein